MSRFARNGKKRADTPRNVRGGVTLSESDANSGNPSVNWFPVMDSIPFDDPRRQRLKEALVARIGQVGVQVFEFILRRACQTVRYLARIVEAPVCIHAFAHPHDIAFPAELARLAQQRAKPVALVIIG